MAKSQKVEKLQTESKFKIKKKVTGVEFFKLEVHEPAYLKFDSQITTGTMKKKVANFANVVDLTTGEIKKLLVPTVLVRLLHENYPNDSFVGLSFQIIKGEKVQGAENSYYEFDVSEIES